MTAMCQLNGITVTSSLVSPDFESVTVKPHHTYSIFTVVKPFPRRAAPETPVCVTPCRFAYVNILTHMCPSDVNVSFYQCLFSFFALAVTSHNICLTCENKETSPVIVTRSSHARTQILSDNTVSEEEEWNAYLLFERWMITPILICRAQRQAERLDDGRCDDDILHHMWMSHQIHHLVIQDPNNYLHSQMYELEKRRQNT